MSRELIFDTLQYANKLKSAGVPDRQAEVHAEALAGMIDDRLVTKQYLRRSLKELELRMIIKLSCITMGSISVLVLLMKLFKL